MTTNPIKPELRGTDADREAEPSIRDALDTTEKGKPVGTILNAVHVLSTDERWKGRIRWAKFEKMVVFDGKPLRDVDLTRIIMWLDEVYGLRPSTDNLHRAITFVAEANAFHGPCDWLNGLAWDGVPRLDLFLARYLKAEDTPLHRKFSSALFIGACARVFEPGCQLDTMLMLIGKQGVGKSNLCAALPPKRAWLGEAGFDIGNKDAFMALHGKWFYELAECDSLKRASDSAAKAFITCRVDRYRTPFARLAEDHPRETVFLATGNEEEVLSDPTGARRYWPVRVTSIDIDGLRRERDQLFAEAVNAYLEDEQWWPDGDFEVKHIKPQQAERYEGDAWEDAIRPYLRTMSDSQDPRTTINEVASAALDLPVGKIGTRDQRRIAACLTQCGWVKGKRGAGGTRYWVPPQGTLL